MRYFFYPIAAGLFLSYAFPICVKGWPIPFAKNSRSQPSIEIRLAPPEDPWPQVSALIQTLTRQRLQAQEALMEKLEDVYNKMLDTSQTEIMSTVRKGFAPMEDSAFLRTAMEGALLPLTHPGATPKRGKNSARFNQLLRCTEVKENVNKHNYNEAAYESTFYTSSPADFMQQTNTSLKESNTTKTATEKMPASIDTSPKKSSDKDRQRVSSWFRDGPVHLPFFSFLQIKNKVLESEKQAGFPGSDAVANVMKKLQNSAAPSVNVELVDAFEPDSSIEDKIVEIDQKRNDEEGKMFELAAEEFEQLTKIMTQELMKNIQIQINSFLVDAKAVGTTLSSILSSKAALPKPKGRFRQKVNEISPDISASTTASASQKSTSFNSSSAPGPVQPYKDLILPNKTVKSFTGGPISLDRLVLKDFPVPTSFLQLRAHRAGAQSLRSQAGGKSAESSTADASSTGFLNPEQLNVKIGTSDQPYPTIGQLVSEMMQRASATTRLERAKILELQLHLMLAQDEMIKDALHTGVARVVALAGKAVEAIKVESMPLLVGG